METSAISEYSKPTAGSPLDCHILHKNCNWESSCGIQLLHIPDEYLELSIELESWYLCNTPPMCDSSRSHFCRCSDIYDFKNTAAQGFIQCEIDDRAESCMIARQCNATSKVNARFVNLKKSVKGCTEFKTSET